MTVDLSQLRCAICGELIPPDPEWSDADARAEAEAKGIDPDESDVVCDACYKRTPWGGSETSLPNTKSPG